MLKITTRNFIISAPANAKTGCRLMTIGESRDEKFDKIQDVYLEVVKGQKVNLVDLAYAIANNCFDGGYNGESGLNLLAEKLRCHVKSRDKEEYEFVVPWLTSDYDYLRTIASQVEL